MARSFNAGQHPRDRFGRFTKSRTVKATARDKAAAKQVADGFAPTPVTDRKAYLEGLSASKPGGLGKLTDVNKALRAGRDSPDTADLEQSMVALPDDVLLSRRVPLTAFGSTDPQLLAGMKVRDAGFAPTQLGTVQAADGQVRMRIAAPAGTKAAVDAATGEVVLDRDTEMVVARVEPNPAGGVDMYLTVLPKTTTESGPNEDAPEGADQVRADLMKLKVPALQAQMRERGLKPGKLRKSQMVDALIADETGEDDPSGRNSSPPTQTATPQPDLPFTERLSAAATRGLALDSVPLSLVRTETHARLGNRGGLSVASRDALAAYQGSGFRDINRELRGENTSPDSGPTVMKRIQAIDAAMAGSSLPRDVVTWRGMRTGRGLFGERLNGDLTGMEWRETAYVSSSTSQETGEEFAGSKGVLMRMLTPAGVGAVQVSDDLDDAGRPDEAEILLERGVAMRVVADRGIGSDGRRYLDVETIFAERG